jgi:hypothetical protein
MLNATDRSKLASLLDKLAGAVEELLLTGLTTASQSTRQTLDVSFREASRLRLLRLSSTLRVANEELGRFTRNESEFSSKRLSFFLNRAWLLARGLARAIRLEDEPQWNRLLWTPATQPVERLDVVTLGVAKKVSAGAFCAFEFRLRTVADAPGIPAGRRLVWSCVFPTKSDIEVPPEGFLHLPQKQKFKAIHFLDKKVLRIEKAAVALDDSGGGRISLDDRSTVTLGEPFTGWDAFAAWDIQAALRRLETHEPGPLDLEVEMQEEVILDDWQLGPEERRDGQTVFPILAQETSFDAVVSDGAEGDALRESLGQWSKRTKRPPLFALLHYEMCRLVLQPLAVLGPQGPEQLMISKKTIDPKVLLQALKF